MRLLKYIGRVLRYIFENGPNIAFWLGMIIIATKWLSHTNVAVRFGLVIVSLFALTGAVRKVYKEVKTHALTSSANAGLGGHAEPQSMDKISILLKNVPSEASLRAVYSYARNYARNWASDGELKEITYYVELKEAVIDKRAQIFIESRNRAEQLTTYLPKISDSIREFETEDSLTQGTAPAIYKFPKWKSELKRIIEKSASDIAKADVIKIQLSPDNDALRINIYYEKGKREWVKRFSVAKH